MNKQSDWDHAFRSAEDRIPRPPDFHVGELVVTRSDGEGRIKQVRGEWATIRLSTPQPGGIQDMTSPVWELRRRETFFAASSLQGRALPEREWHVADLVPGSTVTLLNGDGGTGKSLLALQLAVATALGRPWLGPRSKPRSGSWTASPCGRSPATMRCSPRSTGNRACSLPRRSTASSIGASPTESPPSSCLILSPTCTPATRTSAARPGSSLASFAGSRSAIAAPSCSWHTLRSPAWPAARATRARRLGTGLRSRLYLKRIANEGHESDPDARRMTTKKANHGRVGLEVGMHWREGVFVVDEAESGLDRIATASKAERVFLKLLRQHTEQGRRVNANGGSTYAPKVFAESIEAEGVTKRAFNGAMDALFHAGKVRNETTGPASRAVTFIAEVAE